MAMFPPSMDGPTRSLSANVDTSRPFSALYFGYASNLSPSAMKGRCPGSLFCGLARLSGWKWHINETGYANVIPSPKSENEDEGKEDVVYGSLYFLSPRDEAGLDESEGVPWLYEKQNLEVERLGPDGKEIGQRVTATVYVDVRRTVDGPIMPDYVVWIRKAIKEGKTFGLPQWYAEQALEKWLPARKEGDDEEAQVDAIEMVRVMRPRTEQFVRPAQMV
jgi:gamma-glutamylcyclotransferase